MALWGTCCPLLLVVYCVKSLGRKEETMNASKVSLRKKAYYGWVIVALGFILTTCQYACVISASGVFLLPVTNDLGFSIGEFSQYIMILSISAMVSLFACRRFMTESFMKRLLVTASGVGACTFALFSAASELWQFYLLAIPMGFTFGCGGITPIAILVNNWFGPQKKGFALALALSGTTVGGMLAILLLNGVVQTMSWHAGYLLISAAMFCICVPCVLKMTVWSPENLGLSRLGDSEIQASKEQTKGTTFKQEAGRLPVWLLLASCALVVFASSSILQHTQTFLMLNGFTAEQGSLVVSLLTGMLAVGNIAVGAFCDRFSVRFAALTTCLIFSGVFFAQVFIPQASWLVVLLILCYGFGCPAVNVVAPLMAHRMFGDKDFGTFVNYINIAISFGGCFGATAVGYIYDGTGSYIPAWIMMGAVLVVTGIIRFAIIPKESPVIACVPSSTKRCVL